MHDDKRQEPAPIESWPHLVREIFQESRLYVSCLLRHGEIRGLSASRPSLLSVSG